MNLNRLLEWSTPLILLSLVGVLFIVQGLFNPERENNALQFIFGVPIMMGAAGVHFLIRRLLNRNTLFIWIVEAVLVAALVYRFLHS